MQSMYMYFSTGLAGIRACNCACACSKTEVFFRRVGLQLPAIASTIRISTPWWIVHDTVRTNSEQNMGQLAVSKEAIREPSDEERVGYCNSRGGISTWSQQPRSSAKSVPRRDNEVVNNAFVGAYCMLQNIHDPCQPSLVPTPRLPLFLLPQERPGDDSASYLVSIMMCISDTRILHETNLLNLQYVSDVPGFTANFTRHT